MKNAIGSNRLTQTRRAPAGAEFFADAKGTHFRVWAPQRRSATVIFADQRTPVALEGEPGGYFSGFAEGVVSGAHYKFQLDGDEAYPDPASRFQTQGPHSWSEVIDGAAFAWTDSDWRGVSLKGQVIYELHLGTFTPEGTWRSAAEKLPYLRDTGITVIEVMPVADFPGRFGWGYDGVLPYAPAGIYGRPDDMRMFIDQAHAIGLAVILDVVYNHLGPDGNYLPKFSPFYLTDNYETDWGPAINFDGEQNRPVREFFRENAAYWIREFHLDGLRLDATQDIHDNSAEHILIEIGRAAREAADNRSIVLVAENEPQDTHLIKPMSDGGFGLDALWNDDFHHSAMVALTGKADAYYTDYRGSAREFVAAAKYGFLYQGQWYSWQKKRRGTPAFGFPCPAFITFIQNHDQVANSARGQRVQELTSPGMLKAMTALALLGAGTPMLFQGQEFAASSPFLFFADHDPELAKKVRKGRVEFLEQWRSLKLPEMRQCFDEPSARQTFERSKLNHVEVSEHAQMYALHRDLLRLRREDPVISLQGCEGLDGAALSDSCFVLRFFSSQHRHDRLLVVNLGTELDLNPLPEPLLAPPLAAKWNKLWSTEDPAYGGCGTAAVDADGNWRIPGQAAILLFPQPVSDTRNSPI